MKCRRSLLGLLVLGLWAAFPVQAPAATTRIGSIHEVGTAALTAAGASAPASPELQVAPEIDSHFEKAGSGNLSDAESPVAGLPTVAGSTVISAPDGMQSFDGLNVYREAQAQGVPAIPPDQGLAVGNGYVVEAVNQALAVYDADSGAMLAVVGLRNFFAPSGYRQHSDPRAWYDAQDGRWFVTDGGINPVNSHYGVLIAVSETSDPTGSYHVYFVDTTSSNHPGCPCLGDQPLIGADANGFYTNTNEFGLVTGRFVGTETVAIDKAGLLAGSADVNTETFFLQADSYPIFYSLQPATVPPGGTYEGDHGGTEYFMGSLDDYDLPSTTLAVLALTNTSSLATSPDLHLKQVLLRSETYGPGDVTTQDIFLPAAEQPIVPVGDYKDQLPLAYELRHGTCNLCTILFGLTDPINDHEELLDTGDDRMKQVFFADGHLYGALDTGVKTQTGNSATGIAWFVVTPGFDGNSLTATMYNEGYLSVDGQTVMYPSIAVNSAGHGAMVFTLVGKDYFPSAAFTSFDADNGPGEVQIFGTGGSALDDATGYPPMGPRYARFGDYSAAACGGSGAIWMATEYVPGGANRDGLGEPSNWSTRIGKVTP